jgi:hypothetical protein
MVSLRAVHTMQAVTSTTSHTGRPASKHPQENIPVSTGYRDIPPCGHHGRQESICSGGVYFLSGDKHQ